MNARAAKVANKFTFYERTTAHTSSSYTEHRGMGEHEWQQQRSIKFAIEIARAFLWLCACDVYKPPAYGLFSEKFTRTLSAGVTFHIELINQNHFMASMDP